MSERRLNILLITADDMNWDSPGCFGGRTPGITPNIDNLSKRSIRFERAHVNIAVCQPSRSSIMTGLYPHHNGAMGFEPIKREVSTLQEHLHSAGYLNGILGKVDHLQPESKFFWDYKRDFWQLGCGRNCEKYYRSCSDFFYQAAREDRPFFLMANSHDPHRPFHGSRQEREEWEGWRKMGIEPKDVSTPSRVYGSDEIKVPGFLADLPDVRKEIAEYYSSVRRCDDTVGAIMRALSAFGMEKNTLLMFLSDNGMAFPFAKTNCYLHSTRTPWLVCWPGRTKPGTVDAEHFISGIDFTPTILDAAGIKPACSFDGSSFLPLLNGEKQKGRERVFTVFHTNVFKDNYPMRCVQDERFGYICNAWSDGKATFRNESQSGLTMHAMQEAAKTDSKVADRVELFLHRVPEELYDFQSDPDALINLVNLSEHRERLEQMRKVMLEWMKKTSDSLLSKYANMINAK